MEKALGKSMRYRIKFRARLGKAPLKKKAQKTFKRLKMCREYSLIEGNDRVTKLYERKLKNLGGFLPKICHCTREEISKELKI